MTGIDRRALSDALLHAATPYALIGMDLDRRIVEVSGGAERLLGWSSEELVGQLADIFFTPEDRAAGVPAQEARVALEGGFPRDDRWHIRKSGERFWANGEMIPLRAPSGTAIGLAKLLRDRTDRLRVEIALEEANHRLTLESERIRISQRAGRIGAFEWDLAAHTMSPTPEFCALFGLPVVAQMSLEDLALTVVEEDRERLRPREEIREFGYAEYRILRPDNGEIRWIARRGEIMQVGDKARGYGVVWDITDSKRVEDAIREMNVRLEEKVAERTQERDRMWRLSTDLMLVTGLDGVVASVNPAWAQTLGWTPEELAGRTIIDLVHVDDRPTSSDQLRTLAQGQVTERLVIRMFHKDGSLRWISWTASPGDNYVHAVGRDITPEKAAEEALRHTEEALRQAQKMEAVGQLTGGIAHDFNNLLTGIIGSLEMMQRRIDAGRTGDIHRFMLAATTSAKRAAALVHRLLAFSRRQSLDPQSLDVNVLVASVEDLLRRTLGEAVDLHFQLDPQVWRAHTDANQLESALLNLAINARDAVAGHGQVTIETSNTRLDAAYTDQFEDLEPGDYVLVCVSDNGIGMSPEIAARAFDPFFTTKPIGKGTGLGLSMVYGFAKQSGGHTAIYSEVGAGASVKLYLPRDHAGAEARSAESQAPARARDGETVLVVEDELSVRMLVREVLGDMGYRCYEAGDADEALSIIRGGERLDLLLTDVGLPGLNGRQLAQMAREHRPDLKVLFMTGYAETAAVRAGFLDAGTQMVMKPFALDTMTAKIREMIGADR